MIGILWRFLIAELLLSIVSFLHPQDEKCEICFPKIFLRVRLFSISFSTLLRTEPSSADCVKSTFDATDV